MSPTASRSARARCRGCRASSFRRRRSATSWRTSRTWASIASPHTSAGRVPTPRGYRFFVDTLLTLRPLEEQQTSIIEGQLRGGDPQRSMQTAAQLLSSLSQFAGVVLTPRRSSSFKQLEFVRLSERRVLLIIVTPGRRRAEPHSDDADGLHAVAADRGREHAERAFRRSEFRPRRAHGCRLSCGDCARTSRR